MNYSHIPVKILIIPIGFFLLLFVIFAGTAFSQGCGPSQRPSGRDACIEPGRSATQGRSPSDPDKATNGGPDKPGQAGGVNKQDQDGNNGCGNDQDFEDDNKGKCLGPVKKRTPVPTTGITPTVGITSTVGITLTAVVTPTSGNTSLTAVLTATPTVGVVSIPPTPSTSQTVVPQNTVPSATVVVPEESVQGARITGTSVATPTNEDTVAGIQVAGLPVAGIKTLPSTGTPPANYAILFGTVALLGAAMRRFTK